MRDRDLAADAIDHERLRVFDRARAGGRITSVPDRARAFELRQFVLAENLRNQAHVLVQTERRARAVAGHDAGAFLAAMLQREKSVIGQHGRVRMAEHAEKAALVLRHDGGLWSLVDIEFVRGRNHNR